MNYTTINALPGTLSPELRAVFIFIIAVNVISCPFVILPNILVMVAVQTKRQLRTKSNVSLACLATTDPACCGTCCSTGLQIVRYSFMLKGETGINCTRVDRITTAITLRCVIVSLNHFVVLSKERCLAIKHCLFRAREPCC